MSAIRWLLSRGVELDDLINPWPLRLGRAVFRSGRFDETPMGEPAYILRVIDGDGYPIDEVAWRPPSQLALRDGIGWALGQGQFGRDGIGSPIGRALPVRRDPLEWLRAHRTGVVIVDWDMAARVLAGARIEAAALTHEIELQRRLALKPPEIQTAGGWRQVAA